MRTFVIAALGAVSFAASAVAAQAAPAAAEPVAATAGLIQHVAEGCGPGSFRNARGFCRPMRGMRGMRRGRVRTCVTRRTPRGIVRRCRVR